MLNNITNKVKLVIWDLDDTFWKGTLSEGQINDFELNKSIVISLTERGVINSISSKNNFDDAKNQLLKIGIWDYFVFPSINWNPKGNQIKEIIEKCQLRSENVLFIDDNHLNLEEAKYYNQGLMTIEPKDISELLINKNLYWKDDKKLTKLNQYKLLERRNFEKETYSDNIEFLKTSNIRLVLKNLDKSDIDRIDELINKTNQLNFTKIRLTIDQIQLNFFNDFYDDIKLINVKDKFGDYGLTGLYALKNNELVHFCFSCRILNLGVEQFIYSFLNRPKIKINGDVSSNLDNIYNPYIKIENQINISLQNEDLNQKKKSSQKLLIRGGCDLNQTYAYLEKTELRFKTEFNYGYNNIDIRRESLLALFQAQKLNKEEKKYLIDNLFFYKYDMFKSDALDNLDYLIYSFLTEYSRGFYQSINFPNIQVLYGNFDIDITDKSNWNFLRSENYSDKDFFDLSFLSWFSENFKYMGSIPKNVFENLLNYLISNSKAEKLVFLTGSEFNYVKKSKNSIDSEHNRNLIHIFYNDILRSYKSERVEIIEVDNYIKGIESFSDNIRHYSRKVYFELSKEILDIVNSVKINKRNMTSKYILDSLKDFIRKIKRSFKKITKI
jgi:FkbH-like protein